MRPKTYFFNRVNDIPLNIKFLLIYVICILVPVIFLNAIFLERLLAIVHDREANNYRISLERTRTDIGKLIDSCIAVSHSISTDTNLYEVLDRSFENSSDYYDLYDSLLRNRLNMYTAAYDYISSIVIYVDNQTIWPGGTYLYIGRDVKNSSWYREVASSNANVLIKSYAGITNSIPTRPLQYLSILRMSRGYPEQGIHEKVLKVDLDVGRLYDIVMREKDYLDIFLVDSEGNIVSTTEDRYRFDPVKGLCKFNQDMLSKDSPVYESTLGEANYLKGWRLIGIPNKERLSGPFTETIVFVVVLALTIALISSLLIFVIVRSYNYRLKKLSKHMLKLKDGQFDLIEMSEGKDEIGGVIKNFNHMATKINTLINDVYKLELQKKNLELERVRAELNFLQSQMNPHFLFNTLNAMLVDCTKGNYPAVEEILKYLSKPLRRLMVWKDDIVSVQEELDFTEMYLKIEKYRFREKFNYEIKADQGCRSCRVPKMSLQPLVENACKHGIQGIKGVGTVLISISLQGERLFVEVEDNGTGMDSIKLEDIIKKMTGADEPDTNIGIRNVYRRLKLYYGDDVLFNIESAVNAGTRVVFAIPAVKLA